MSTPLTMTTPVGSALTFHSMGGIEGLSIPFQFELEATSKRSDIDAKSLLGQSVTVHLDLANGQNSTRHWNGRVTRFDYVETGNDGLSRYRMTLRAWIWQLGLSADCRIFQNMTVPDIVEQIFHDRGFTDFDRSLFGDYAAHEYIVQYRETDLHFVSRLLEREGIYYFFRHTDGKHTLVLADSPHAHDTASGYANVPYAAEDENRDQTMQYVRRWRSESQLEPGRYSIADFDFTKPRVRLSASDSAQDDDVDAAREIYDYPGGFDTFPDGTSIARVRLEQARRDNKTWVGETNARGFGVAHRFTLEDHPRSEENRGYLVVYARVRLRGTDETSGDTPLEEPFVSSFRVVADDQTFRPPLRGHKPTVRGPQTATVVGGAGQEIWTDQYGRVKVQFHWDRKGAGDQTSSCWVRVAQAWAGSGWGAQFVPRIGDEVIVDFLEGDPDRPIITGSVYNGANSPPFKLPDNQTQSGFRTRSTPGGSFLSANEIRFEDRIGQEEFYIQAEKDMRVLVKHDETSNVMRNRTTNVDVNDSLHVGVNHTRSIDVAETVIVGAAQTTLVGGIQTVTVTAKQLVSVGADRELHIKGADTMSVGANQTVSVGGALSRTVEGTFDSTTKGDLLQTIGGRTVSNHADHHTLVVSNDHGDRSATLHVKGAADAYASTTITATADGGITIICGTSKIALLPDSITLSSKKLSFVTQEFDVDTAKMTVGGTDAVAITGSKVTLKSSGANVTLDSNATVQGAQVKLGSGSGDSAQASSKPPKTTTLILKDPNGKPLANRTVVLRYGGEGGPEKTVVLDDQGQVVVTGDDSFEVFFPNVQNPSKS